MKSIITLFLFVSCCFYISAQDQTFFYATMSAHHAEELSKDAPQEIEIIATYRNEAAVRLTPTGSHKLHDRILTHGPGYIHRNSEEEAVQAIQRSNNRIASNTRAAANFSITEDVVVLPTLDLIQTQNIEDHIIELENYGTRHHSRPSGIQAAIDLNTNLDDIVYSEAIENALTITKNANDILPIKNLEDKKVAYVSLGDDSGTYFLKEMRKYDQVSHVKAKTLDAICLLYTSPSPRDQRGSRMPSSA